MAEIIPNLWIGNIRHAQNLEFLAKHKITTIINCTTKYPFPSSHSLNIKKIRLPVRDRGVEQDFDVMLQCLHQIVPVIFQYLEQGERILIHCYAGCHRSVTVVLAFLVKYADMQLQEAIDTLQSKWPNVGLNFLKSLTDYCISIR